MDYEAVDHKATHLLDRVMFVMGKTPLDEREALRNAIVRKLTDVKLEDIPIEYDEVRREASRPPEVELPIDPAVVAQARKLLRRASDKVDAVKRLRLKDPGQGHDLHWAVRHINRAMELEDKKLA